MEKLILKLGIDLSKDGDLAWIGYLFGLFLLKYSAN
jgi:hypothetical protein